jgi:hypothetical protein
MPMRGMRPALTMLASRAANAKDLHDPIYHFNSILRLEVLQNRYS